MIYLYYSTSSKSCRCAREWLTRNNLAFTEINLNKTSSLSKSELLHILSLTESGTDEIISKNSVIYSELDINFDDLTLEEILALFNKHRSLLRRPLIVDDKRLQVGFNDQNIRQFIPRKVRKAQKELLEQKTPQNYNTS